MRILLLLANPAIEDFFKSKKEEMDIALKDTVFFHSLNYNCSDEEVFKSVRDMKPEVIIYRYGKKDNNETLEFIKEIKQNYYATNVMLLSDNFSLVYMDKLYSLGCYDLFIGKQIEIKDIIERIIDNQKLINKRKEYNSKKVENLEKDIQLVSKNKVESTFILAENFLPEGVVIPNCKKRASLSYYNLSKRNDIFKVSIVIDYYDAEGVEKSYRYNGFMDKAAKVLSDLSEFDFKEEEFYEDYRGKYSSYDIIYDNFRVHGNMNWDGLFKQLSEYTKFDILKKVEMKDIVSNEPYEQFLAKIERLYGPKEETNVLQTQTPVKKGLFGFKK